MRALASWCVRHRRAVVALWLVVLVTTVFIAHAVGSAYSDNFSLPGTPSTEALNLIRAVAPGSAGDTEQVVFATTNGQKVTAPAMEARIKASLAAVARLPQVALNPLTHQPEIVAPLDVGPYKVNAHYVSQSGTIAFATVTLSVLGQSVTQPTAAHIVDAATAGSGHGLTIAMEGQVAENAARPSIGGAKVGFLAALVVLLLVFASLFAALMPLMSAVVALGTATSIIELVSHVLEMPTFTGELVLLIGLGVGVDYALFIVTRHRQGLLQGMSTDESIINAVNTSGRAVFFAGIIVCVAMLGMLALGVSFLAGMAIAASIGVAFTMFAALTLLPAALSFIGPRILSRSQHRQLAARGPRAVDFEGTSFWERWSRLVSRNPWAPAVVAVAVVGLLAAPFFSMTQGHADAGNDPAGSTTRVAYDLLAKGFGPGFNGPLQLVAKIDSTTPSPALARVLAAVATTKGVAAVEPPQVIPSKKGGGVEVVNVLPTTSPQSTATDQLITELRDQVIPRALGPSPSVRVLVGGVTAIYADFSAVLASKLPLFVGVVVLVSFLLLGLVFRSIAIPVISAVMNLISIGAALGVLTAVFQWGWLATVFGVDKSGPIEAFLPVMAFAILFGLSMDYQVFLVTRMHEEWRRCADHRTAIRLGLARTGKTISAAALIMIVVFGSFILGGERIIKEFGLVLAGGVAVDALVIRMAIVPAVLLLTGRATWWFPRFLDRRVPKIGLEHD